MAFDYKKEYKEFYMPKSKISLDSVVPHFTHLNGKGNPIEQTD